MMYLILNVMNVLLPEIVLFLDKRFHHLNTGAVLNKMNLNPLWGHYTLSKGWEVDVFPHHHPFDLIKKRGAGAHDTRGECWHKSELLPVSTTSRVPDGHDLRVSCGVSVLHSEVVTCVLLFCFSEEYNIVSGESQNPLGYFTVRVTVRGGGSPLGPDHKQMWKFWTHFFIKIWLFDNHNTFDLIVRGLKNAFLYP